MGQLGVVPLAAATETVDPAVAELEAPEGKKSCNTGFLSEIGTKLRDWAVGQAGGSS